MDWTRNMDDQDALDERVQERRCVTCRQCHTDDSLECQQCYKDAYADYIQERNDERRLWLS